MPNNKPKIHLHRQWKKIVRRAWSVRLMCVAAILQGAEVVMPMFIDKVPHKYQAAFGIATVFAIAGAFLARIIKQKDM